MEGTPQDILPESPDPPVIRRSSRIRKTAKNLQFVRSEGESDSPSESAPINPETNGETLGDRSIPEKKKRKTKIAAGNQVINQEITNQSPQSGEPPTQSAVPPTQSAEPPTQSAEPPTDTIESVQQPDDENLNMSIEPNNEDDEKAMEEEYFETSNRLQNRETSAPIDSPNMEEEKQENFMQVQSRKDTQSNEMKRKKQTKAEMNKKWIFDFEESVTIQEVAQEIQRLSGEYPRKIQQLERGGFFCRFRSHQRRNEVLDAMQENGKFKLKSKRTFPVIVYSVPNNTDLGFPKTRRLAGNRMIIQCPTKEEALKLVEKGIFFENQFFPAYASNRKCKICESTEHSERFCLKVAPKPLQNVSFAPGTKPIQLPKAESATSTEEKLYTQADVLLLFNSFIDLLVDKGVIPKNKTESVKSGLSPALFATNSKNKRTPKETHEKDRPTTPLKKTWMAPQPRSRSYIGRTSLKEFFNGTGSSTDDDSAMETEHSQEEEDGKSTHN